MSEPLPIAFEQLSKECLRLQQIFEQTEEIKRLSQCQSLLKQGKGLGQKVHNGHLAYEYTPSSFHVYVVN